MFVGLDNMLKISQIPQNIEDWVKRCMTFSNPRYYQMKKMGYSTNDISPTIKLYIQDKKGIIHVPRGFATIFLNSLNKAKIKYELFDMQLELEEVDYGSKIQLRDYQEEAVKRLLYFKQGGVVAGCGAGKTIILLQAISQTKQPALWITHTKELAYQAIERAEQTLSITKGDIGIIGDGKFEIGRKLTVSLVQTLMNIDIQAITDKFGCIVVDEAHRMAARSFYVPVNQFPAKYRFWVSATPERSDGLTQVVTSVGGPIIYRVGRESVPTIIPKLKIVMTEFYSHDDNYQALLTDVVSDEERNQLICETIVREMKKGDYLLVLSDRLEHLKILKERLKRMMPYKKIKILTGQLTKKEREQTMLEVKNKEVDILLATQLAREGLDLPFLNKLFLVCPKKAEGAIQQEVGRIMRPYEGKGEAVVYDFVDIRHGLFEYQAKKRLEAYRKIGIEVEKCELI